MSLLIEKFRSIIEVDKNAVLSGDAIGEKYCADWSGLPPEKPLAVLRPNSTEQLSEMLSICHAMGQPVVTQGGMTGLVGAATPVKNEVALSLERMSGIEELDTDSMTMTVLAGTTLEEIQKAATDSGFYMPLDLGARGSCTIGGNIATNAGGNQVVRYGMTRDLVLGVEAVLADGTVVSSLNKVIKNNTGYDLKQLFIGSEGTLGIVTRAVLKLQPLLARTYTALCAASEFKNILAFFKQAQAELPGGVCAFEVMWASYYDYVIEHAAHINNPFQQQHDIYALVQYQGVDKPALQEMFEQLLVNGLEQGVLDDVLMAQSIREENSFWQIRDGIGDVMGSLEPFVGFDISVPLKEMDTFVGELKQQLRDQFCDTELLLFGHIGDSNLHIVVRLGEADKAQVSDLVYQQVSEYQGSISAEHGIGRLKKKYLPLSRSKEEIELMRTLKRALDPKGILNCGRVI